MTEEELYKELGALTKNKEKWKESIPYVSSLLTHDSVKIEAKALWLLGEMGLIFPQSVQAAVPAIASFLDSPEPLLRERAVNAIGRIGRGSYTVIETYWTDLFRFAADEEPKSGWRLSGRQKTSLRTRRVFTRIIFRYLRNFFMMQMTKYNMVIQISPLCELAERVRNSVCTGRRPRRPAHR